MHHQFLTRPKLADTEQGDDLRIGHKGQALLLLDHLRNIIHTQDTFHLSQDGEYHHASNDAEKESYLCKCRSQKTKVANNYLVTKSNELMMVA